MNPIAVKEEVNEKDSVKAMDDAVRKLAAS